nr:hypothetical protein [Xylanibacter ruminicola]
MNVFSPFCRSHIPILKSFSSMMEVRMALVSYVRNMSICLTSDM